jgi:hypothetical protein
VGLLRCPLAYNVPREPCQAPPRLTPPHPCVPALPSTTRVIFSSVSYRNRLILFGVLLSTSAPAQAQTGPVPYTHALDDGVFQNCDEVLSRAISLAAETRESAFMMELFPKSRGSVARPFPSEVHAESAAGWLASHDTKSIPYALFYFLKGSYALRCRDTDGRYIKLSGPFGSTSPLELNLASSKAEIWYFYLMRNHNALVFMVTDLALKTLSTSEESALIARVKEVLNARFVQSIYLRNDPWFLGTAPDSLIYLFTDSFQRMTLEEYRATKTLDCNENTGCEFYVSY